MRAFVWVMVLGGAPGCTLHTMDTVARCKEVATPLSETSWDGPSEPEVLTALEMSLPNVVTWDERTLGVERSSVGMSPARAEGEAQVVTRSDLANEQCRPGPELVVPIQLEVRLGDDEVVSLLTGTVAAGVDGIEPLYVVAEGPAVLNAEWEEAALADVAQQHPDTVAEWRMALYGVPWSESVLDVEALGSNYRSVLWRGHLSTE